VLLGGVRHLPFASKDERTRYLASWELHFGLLELLQLKDAIRRSYRSKGESMKFKKYLAPAVIVLLVLTALGFSFTQSQAKGTVSGASQIEVSKPVVASGAQDCAADEADGTDSESSGQADTDKVEVQCGDQNQTGDQSGDQNDPNDQTGSDTTESQSSGQEDMETAPSGTPALTVEQAKAAALAVHSGTITQIELDDENGTLVYSVAFEGGVDVKVDAMTGAIVAIETGQD
jgi:uncharacterized membrane protein YkoI